MRLSIITAIIATPMILSGCVAPAKYTWGNYDKSLYTYYKDPTKSQEHMAEILSIIQASEKTQVKVAPGIYAEYGYLLMQSGKTDDAVLMFKKEKQNWPESVQFMDSMVKMASNSASNKPLESKE